MKELLTQCIGLPRALAKQDFAILFRQGLAQIRRQGLAAPDRRARAHPVAPGLEVGEFI
jgi:hypothetical protein